MARAGVVRDYGGVSAEERRADRRRRLVAAGRRIWGEQGIGDLTVRGVCAVSGLTPRYFYEHFAHRDELAVAISDEIRAELVATLLQASDAASGGLPARLNAALTAFLELVAADPHVHRILTTEPSGAAGLAEHRAGSVDLVAGLVAERGAAFVDDPPADDELRRIAAFVVGGMGQLIEGWLRDPKETPAELAATCTRLALAVVNGAATA